MTVAENKFKIKDLPVDERPYEKMEKYGAEVLSNAELLAIIIKTGNIGTTSVELAQRILKEDSGGRGIAFLHDLSFDELKKIKGIGRVKALQLKAVLELSKRISTHALGERHIIKSPLDASRLLMEEMRYLKQESFRILMLNVKNHVMKTVNISTGSLTASIVHPREVFSEPIKKGCASIILVHNHPSGDPAPSAEDIDTTKRLIEAGNILGITVLDHIIIGDGKFVSLKDKALI